MALADATAVTATEPEAAAEAVLYGMTWLFEAIGGLVNVGEGAALMAAKSMACAAGKAAAIAAHPARRIA